MTRNTKRAEIAEAEGPSRIALHEVAQKAGVSVATVSRVLNNRANVAAETRERVLASVRELGYIGQRHITATREKAQTGLIAVTAVSVYQGPYPAIIAGITEGLHAHNARPVLCPIPRRHNVGMPLLERLMEGTSDGALLAGVTDTDEELLSAFQSGFPLVVICNDRIAPEGIPTIAVANWAGARSATEHLLSLGHTRIGAITGSSSDAHSIDRLAGFQSALLGAGRPLAPEMIVEGHWQKAGGYQAAQQVLALPNPPTAIFAFNDEMAMGVLQAASERGLRIPADLSLVGFEDTEIARLSIPELTTIQIPWVEMGRLAVNLLYRILDGSPLEATRLEVSTRLIVRSSSGPTPLPQ